RHTSFSRDWSSDVCSSDLTLHKQAIAGANALDEDRWLAVFQSDMGVTLEALNRGDEAEPLYLSALEKSRERDDLENTVRTLTRRSEERRVGKEGRRWASGH